MFPFANADNNNNNTVHKFQDPKNTPGAQMDIIATSVSSVATCALSAASGLSAWIGL